jgi:autotransporter-associated beta strand protein
MAQTSGTWAVDVGTAGGNWSVASNWVGGVIPDGGGTTTFATLPSFTTAPLNIIQDLPTVTLGRIGFDGLITYALARPAGNTTNTITLSGSATVHQNTFNPVSWGTTTNGHFLSIPIAGSSGLTKTGPGTVSMTLANLYTGGTSINGGIIRTTVGDAAFGAANASITLNGGAIRTSSAAFNSPREFNLVGAGTVETTATGTGTISGSITGAGIFNKTGSAKLELTGADTFIGSTNIRAGSLVLSGNGQLSNTTGIFGIGTITLDNTGTNLLDRINDAAGIQFAGGGLVYRGNATAPGGEIMGNATFGSGVNVVSVEAATGQSASITFNSGRNTVGGAAFFRGTSLGAAAGTDVSNVFLNDTPELIGGDGSVATRHPVIPWAFGATATGSSANSATNSLVTYSATSGVRPLDLASEYASSIPVGSVSLDNVRLTAAQTVGSASRINALVLAPGASVDGAGTLTIGSGAILNLAGGSTIACPLNFQDVAATLHAPANVTITGLISGSGKGLTKTGDGAATFANAYNTYPVKVLGGGTISYLSDVPASGPSPFGESGGQINLAAGGFTSVKLQYAGAGSASFDRPLVVRCNNPLGNTVLLPAFGVSGNQSLTMNGDIDLVSPLSIRAGAPGAVITLAGDISGIGHLTDSGNPTVVFTGNNTHTGGVEMNGGSYAIGSDTALGAGPLKISALSAVCTVYAVNGPRVVPNDTVSLSLGSTYWNVAGAEDITFTGSINLSGSYTHNITNTALTTYAGVLHTGGFTKGGSGTLVLSGDNVYTGMTTVSSGVLRISHANALGSVQATTVVAADATLELTGNALSLEPVAISGSGVGGNGAIRNLSGVNSLGPITLADDATIGVREGDLTVGNISSGPAQKLTKTGAFFLHARRVRVGALEVASRFLTIVLGRDPDKTSVVNGSIIFGSGAKLDLRDNDLVLDYDGATILSTVHSQLANGYNGGAWNGSELISSEADADTFALGYADNAVLNLSTFSGQNVDATSVLVRYTYFGDANLDEQVDITDLGLLATNWQTTNVWTGGDFDYSGFVDITDLGMLASNWQAGVAAPSEPTDSDPWAFADAIVGLGFPSASVPEPFVAPFVIGSALFVSRASRPCRARRARARRP